MKNSIKEFLTRGSGFDLSVSILLGFGLYSLYVNILVPFLGLLTGGIYLREKHLPLASGIESGLSADQAREVGIPVIPYGKFLCESWNLFVIGLIVWLVLGYFRRACERRDKFEA